MHVEVHLDWILVRSPNPSLVSVLHLGNGCLDFELTEESGLLLLGLESTVTECRSSVDELEVDLLEVSSGSVHLEGFSEGEDSLSGTWESTLEDDSVRSDETVVRESTERVDA